MVNCFKKIKNIFKVNMNEKIYYWYVGTENPMNMTSIINSISSNDPSTASEGAGWRTIGSTLPTYSKTNQLWNSDYIIKLADVKTTIYVALPSDQIKQRNEITEEDITLAGWMINPNKKMLNGVEYTIWSSINKLKTFRNTLF